MDGLCRLVSNHRTLAKVFFSVLLLIDLVCLMPQKSLTLIGLILIALILLFIEFVFIDNCYVQLLKKPGKLLNDYCDPYPYLEQTELLLTYKLTDMAHQLLLIDQAAILLALGKEQEAYDTLTSMNIDKYSGILPVYKASYYNNLACSCLLLNKNEEARIWFDKSQLIEHDIRNPKMKKLLAWGQSTTYAELLYNEGNYTEALDVLSEVQAETLQQKVSYAMLLGKLFVASKDYSKAAEYLNFVCINGNRMHAVTEAKSLLEKLKNSEISC